MQPPAVRCDWLSGCQRCQEPRKEDAPRRSRILLELLNCDQDLDLEGIFIFLDSNQDYFNKSFADKRLNIKTVRYFL